MKRFLYELTESWKIALSQMQANKTRSMLTALGVIIGIVAVTLMGTAITGISKGFDKSMSILGDDVLYVSQFPWARVNDWWNYRDRREIKTEYAETLNRLIAATPNSNLIVAVPTSNLVRNVKYGENQVSSVFLQGTTADYPLISTVDFTEGRFFNELETKSAANVCVVGYDVADALFPSGSPVGKNILIGGQQFRVLGVGARQGSFLGLFSLDSIVIVPLPAFKKYFSAKSESDVRVKLKDKNRIADAKDELTGLMRRVRALQPEKKNDFNINEQQAFKSTLDPVKNSIAIAGLFITGPIALRRRDRHHEYHVCERKRANEGDRHAESSRRASTHHPLAVPDRIDRALHARGLIGLAFAYVMCFGLGRAFPSFPIDLSISLVVISMFVSVLTGLVSGFAPAWSASRLDPVTALRYE
jgi:putative ABC transport system permease protein